MLTYLRSDSQGRQDSPRADSEPLAPSTLPHCLPQSVGDGGQVTGSVQSPKLSKDNEDQNKFGEVMRMPGVLLSETDADSKWEKLTTGKFTRSGSVLFTTCDSVLSGTWMTKY